MLALLIALRVLLMVKSAQLVKQPSNYLMKTVYLLVLIELLKREVNANFVKVNVLHVLVTLIAQNALVVIFFPILIV